MEHFLKYYSTGNNSELKTLSDPVINYGVLGNFSTAGFQLLLSRKISPYITSYYLPSGNYIVQFKILRRLTKIFCNFPGLLVCLSWITFLIPMEAVLGRLSVAMIPLFYLLHLLVNITASFPKSTDGMNALQIWLLSCLGFVLATFLQ